ncbi:MAG: isochorismatase family cysteine hydrolase [Alphaproteobacteria bacterium]
MTEADAPPPMQPTPGRTGLVVVDMQNGFCDDKGSCAQLGLDIGMLKGAVEPCKQLIAAARAADVPVIYTRYVCRPDYADGGILMNTMMPAFKDVNGLAAGTWDIEVVDELLPQQGDFVVDKNRPSAFYATGLEPILNGLDLDSLIVCGVTTNCCVETTVRDASQRDFKTFVVSDATGELEKQRHDFALATMDFLFGRVVSSNEAMSLMAAKD